MKLKLMLTIILIHFLLTGCGTIVVAPLVIVETINLIGNIKRTTKDDPDVVDADRDMVPDEVDICLETPINEIHNPESGCSITQLCPCEGPSGTTKSWANHMGFQSCTVNAAKDFFKSGLISYTEKEEIVSNVANSQCGYK